MERGYKRRQRHQRRTRWRRQRLLEGAQAALFPIMILLTLTVIMFQVRSFGVLFMVFATAPLGLIGAVPTLLLFNQLFGFNAILGLIGIRGGAGVYPALCSLVLGRERKQTTETSHATAG